MAIELDSHMTNWIPNSKQNCFMVHKNWNNRLLEDTFFCIFSLTNSGLGDSFTKIFFSFLTFNKIPLKPSIKVAFILKNKWDEFLKETLN